MKEIKDYELIDHGIDHPQYFQGCGITFTNFNHVVTGCGQDFSEAIDDALESLAVEGYETEDLEKLILENNPLLGGTLEGHTSPNAHINCKPEHDENCPEDCEEWHDHDECEMCYYVSIRVKE